MVEGFKWAKAMELAEVKDKLLMLLVKVEF
jgi:hypothetical protein